MTRRSRIQCDEKSAEIRPILALVAEQWIDWDRRSISLTRLSLSPPIPLRLYTLPYWSNPSFLIFDIRALWRSLLSARVPECQKLKMLGWTSMAKCKALTGSAVKGLTVLLKLGNFALAPLVGPWIPLSGFCLHANRLLVYACLVIILKVCTPWRHKIFIMRQNTVVSLGCLCNNEQVSLEFYWSPKMLWDNFRISVMCWRTFPVSFVQWTPAWPCRTWTVL